MALGSKENADGYVGNVPIAADSPDSYFDMGNFSAKRRRKKRKRARSAPRRAHSSPRRQRRRKKVRMHVENFKKSKKKGKRPYPFWLKKYQFKKKR